MEKELWKHLKETKKPIVLYGMGNGADKIITVLENFGIPYCDVFASDGFVREKKEKFMRPYTWITNAQVALSTGTSGNSSIPNYDHLALVGGGYIYNGESGIAPSSEGNPDLSWEQLWSSNLALHLGFLHRFNVDIEFYNKLTTDMLMLVPQSYANNGFGQRWDNVGAMVNRGVELSANLDVIRTEDFVWNISGNAS